MGQMLVDQEIISADTLDSLLRFQEGRRQRAQAADVQVENGNSESILHAALNAGANEVVVSEGRQVLIRVAGQLRNLSPKAVASPG